MQLKIAKPYTDTYLEKLLQKQKEQTISKYCNVHVSQRSLRFEERVKY